MYGWRAKIGLIAPSTNTTVEMDFHRLVPEGISVHTERLLFSGHTSVKSVDDQTRDMERASEFLSTARVDLIVCGITAPTFYRGAGWDREVAQIIEKKSRIPAITTSTAMIEGMKEMRMNRVCVVSSYPEDLEEKLLTFLTGNGFSVVRSSSFKLKDAWEIARIPGYLIYRMARESFQPNMDGVVIPVTQLRSLDIVEQLEKDLGKPVVAANQASMWFALRKLGLPDRIEGYGELLRRTAKRD
jgi:maleate isomerase